MKKISDRYRTDEVSDLPGDINRLLDDKYWSKISNQDQTNPKVLVVFSGRNGVGKSTLAKKISNELKGLVIENDEIKRVLLKERPELTHRERGLICWNYTMKLFERIDSLSPNGLVVRDAIIDWYFDRILPIFENKGFKIFVVAFDVSEERNRELIVERGDTETVSADLLLNQIKEHEIHISRFRSSYTPNIALNDNNLFDHDLVIRALKNFLSNEL